MNIFPEIILNDLPEEYKKLYDLIMLDERIKKKMDRGLRVNEMFNHVNCYFPEIKNGNLNILDLATGPGEFLEVVNYYNCNGTGVDIDELILNKTIKIKEINEEYFERYRKYIQISRINVIRQKLNVIYADIYDCLMLNNNVFNNLKYDIINCQLAMHLILKDNFNFEKVFYENAIGTWIIDNSFINSIAKTFDFLKSHLKYGGIVLIEADKATNLNEYSEILIKVALKKGFKVEFTNNLNIHKFKKMGILDWIKVVLVKIYSVLKKRLPF